MAFNPVRLLEIIGARECLITQRVLLFVSSNIIGGDNRVQKEPVS